MSEPTPHAPTSTLGPLLVIATAQLMLVLDGWTRAPQLMLVLDGWTRAAVSSV